MKKIILLLIGLPMLTINIQGQVWQSFPTSNSVWNYTCNDPGGSYLFFQEIIGDTIFNSKNYTRLKVHQNLPLINTYPLVREENKRIYQFNPIDSTEFIIYDFNVSVGTKVLSPYSFDSLTVNSIDSIMLENGQYRKRINLSYLSTTDEWVESIGSIKYPIGFYFLGETGGSLWCLYQNYEYLISIFCFYVGIENSTFDETNILYPNPTNGLFSINLEKVEQIERIEIYNLLGELIYLDDSPYLNKSINITKYTKGIYIIKLIGPCFSLQNKIIKL